MLEATEAQKEEILAVVLGAWGGHIQTGMTEEGFPYLFSQLGPNHPIRRAVFQSDGTTVFDTVVSEVQRRKGD